MFRRVTPLLWLYAAALLALAPAAIGAESFGALMERGRQLYEQGQFAESAAAYHQALQQQPLPVVKYNLGTAQAQAADLESAQQLLEESLAQPDPGIAGDAAFNLGLLHYGRALDDQAQQAKHLKNSLGAFRDAILLDPQSADAVSYYETVKLLLDEAKQQEQEQQQQGDGKKDDESEKDDQPQQSQNQQPPDQQQDQKQDQDQQSQSSRGQSDPQDQPKPADQQDQAAQPEETPSERQDSATPQEQEGKHEQPQPQSPRPTPPGGSSTGNLAQNSAAGEPDGEPKGEPSSDEQDALRLLNLLERENPDQFRRVFQRRGTPHTLEKDW